MLIELMMMMNLNTVKQKMNLNKKNLTKKKRKNHLKMKKKTTKKLKKKEKKKKLKNIMNFGENLVKVLNQESLKILPIEKSWLKFLDGLPLKIQKN